MEKQSQKSNKQHFLLDIPPIEELDLNPPEDYEVGDVDYLSSDALTAVYGYIKTSKAS